MKLSDHLDLPQAEGAGMGPRPVSPARPARIGAVLHRYRESAIDIVILFILVQLGCVVAGLVAPNSFPYLSAANVSVGLQAIPELGILALGVGVLMIAGEFDLSVGANYAFTAIVMATLTQQNGLAAFPAAGIAMLLGIAIALLNAAITIRLRIPSFITTLGTALFWDGMTLFYHGASTLRFAPDQTFATLTTGTIGVIQAPFLWFLALAVVFYVALHQHKLGNHLFAVGGDTAAATAIGIAPARVKAIAFAAAGLCAAVSGILATARVGAIEPGQGDALPLQAIAACVIGGVALTGGRGAILGMCLGAALMYTIQDILLLVGAPGFYLNVFVGALIVAAAAFNGLVRQRRGGEP